MGRTVQALNQDGVDLPELLAVELYGDFDAKEEGVQKLDTSILGYLSPSLSLIFFYFWNWLFQFISPPSLSLSLSWAQFHQHSTYSFYTCRSQKRKKILTTWLSSSKKVLFVFLHCGYVYDNNISIKKYILLNIFECFHPKVINCAKNGNVTTP